MAPITPARFLGKGPFLRAIDGLWRGFGSAQKHAVLHSLEAASGAGQRLLELAASLQLGTPADLQHLARDWFGGWWTGSQPIEPILRVGLIQALRLALFDPGSGERRENPLPIESLWLSGVDRVEVGISASEHQVTLLLLTPPVPSAGAAVTEVLDPVWMVHRGEPRDDEQVIGSDEDLVITRVRARTA